MGSQQKHLTATEVLIETLDDFNNSEASEIIVIYMTEDGNMKYSSNITNVATKIGMLDICKESMLLNTFTPRSEDGTE